MQKRMRKGTRSCVACEPTPKGPLRLRFGPGQRVCPLRQRGSPCLAQGFAAVEDESPASSSSNKGANWAERLHALRTTTVASVSSVSRPSTTRPDSLPTDCAPIMKLFNHGL
ncbi:hypothetical protein FQN50_006987, partial [Emmonsiellopsis sp. PD_5]